MNATLKYATRPDGGPDADGVVHLPRRSGVVTPADVASMARGVLPGAHSRARRLLPAESRSFELNSAGALLLVGLDMILGYFLPGVLPSSQRTLELFNGLDFPLLAVAQVLVFFTAAHLVAIVAGPRARFLRTACIFAEFLIWAYAAAASLGLGKFPPGGAPSMVYVALAFSSGWAFLTRTLLSMDAEEIILG